MHLRTVTAATNEMNVKGLVCAFCAQGIEKKLGKLPATADVVVSLEQRLVADALKDGQKHFRFGFAEGADRCRLQGDRH
jgi:copper chaperone CopZ